jgi:hypothetical protein
MRILARLGVGLCGLAITASPLVKADDRPAKPARAVKTPHTHKGKGLFGAKYCVECQREAAWKNDGVDVPPPPSGIAGVVMPDPGRAAPVHMSHVQGPAGNCAACEAGAATVAGSYAPGYASTGDPAIAGYDAPGHAVVGGPDDMMASNGASPSPIGVAKASQGQWGPQVAAGGPRSSFDSSVLPSSMIPAAPTPIENLPSRKPRVISHLLGVSAIGRDLRDLRASRNRDDSHASISYDPAVQPVTELPASVVYGKGGR